MFQDIVYVNRYNWGGSYYWKKPDDPTFKDRFTSFIRGISSSGSDVSPDDRDENISVSETRFPELSGMENGTGYHMTAMDASCFSHDAMVALKRASKV
jgi:hypothetical protein